MDVHSPVTDTNASYAHFKDQRMQSSADGPTYTEQQMVELSIRRPQLWVNSERGCLFRVSRAKYIDCARVDSDDEVDTLHARIASPSRDRASYTHEYIAIARSARRLFISSEHGALLYVTLADNGREIDVCDDNPEGIISVPSPSPRVAGIAAL